MNPYLHQLKKDLRQFWIPLACWTAFLIIDCVVEFYATPEMNDRSMTLSPLGIVLAAPTFIAWIMCTDSWVDPRAFWKSRPVREIPLLLAKFTLITVAFLVLPLVIRSISYAAAGKGFEPWPVLLTLNRSLGWLALLCFTLGAFSSSLSRFFIYVGLTLVSTLLAVSAYQLIWNEEPIQSGESLALSLLGVTAILCFTALGIYYFKRKLWTAVAFPLLGMSILSSPKIGDPEMQYEGIEVTSRPSLFLKADDGRLRGDFELRPFQENWFADVALVEARFRSGALTTDTDQFIVSAHYPQDFYSEFLDIPLKPGSLEEPLVVRFPSFPTQQLEDWASKFARLEGTAKVTIYDAEDQGGRRLHPDEGWNVEGVRVVIDRYRARQIHLTLRSPNLVTDQLYKPERAPLRNTDTFQFVLIPESGEPILLPPLNRLYSGVGVMRPFWAVPIQLDLPDFYPLDLTVTPAEIHLVTFRKLDDLTIPLVSPYDRISVDGLREGNIIPYTLQP